MPEQKRILVMDDMKDMREMLEDFLPVYGYEVEVYEKGEDVLTCVEAGKNFDVFLFDIGNTLGMGGVQTIKEVLKVIPEARVIAMSGDKFPNFKSFGFCEFWNKVEGLKPLLEALKKAGA